MTIVGYLASKKEWDEYVLRHPSATFFHLSGWKEVLERAFGFKAFYLQAMQDGKTTGILPLVMVETFFGRNLFSIPIGAYAGALADSDETAAQLISEAVRLTRENGCGYLQLRHLTPQSYLDPEMFHREEGRVTFIKEMPADATKCLEALPKKSRAAARHGIEQGLRDETGIYQLEECYRIYAGNQRDLGSPTVSRDYFRILTDVFKDSTTVFTAKKDDRAVAGILAFRFKDTVLAFYMASAPGSRKLNPNNFMYLKLQEYAVSNGLRFFDFGRSRKDTGAYRFKINQGIEPRPLYYYYYLNKAKTVPKINPSNPLFKLPQRIWRRLPLFITNRLGPILFKYVIP